MTREEFQQLPVDKAAGILWQISDRTGDLIQIMDIVRGTRYGASYDQARRELAPLPAGVSTLERFYTLDGYHAGAIVRELAEVHPRAEEIVAELGRRRDQLTIDLIDQIMADLDRLPAPAPTVIDEPSVSDDDVVDDCGLMRAERPSRGWLARLLGR